MHVRAYVRVRVRVRALCVCSFSADGILLTTGNLEDVTMEAGAVTGLRVSTDMQVCVTDTDTERQRDSERDSNALAGQRLVLLRRRRRHQRHPPAPAPPQPGLLGPPRRPGPFPRPCAP